MRQAEYADCQWGCGSCVAHTPMDCFRMRLSPLRSVKNFMAVQAREAGPVISVVHVLIARLFCAKGTCTTATFKHVLGVRVDSVK
jgi:hypothetical protein